MMRSLKCGFVVVVQIFCSHLCFAGDASITAMAKEDVKLNWVGATSTPAFMAMDKEYAVEKSAFPQPTRLNLRASQDPQMIEVYNQKKQKWVPISINAHQSSSSPIVLGNGFYTSAIRAWQAQNPVTVILQIDNSTPRAGVYVDGDAIGEIDPNGMLKKNVGTKEKGAVVVVEAKLTKCTNVARQFKANDNPQYFKGSLVLTCAK